MNLWQKVQSFIHNENTRPLPKMALFTLFLLTFVDDMTMTTLFSYLPKLVKWFGTAEIQTGYSAGILASSLYLSRIFSSCIWGYIADHKGRKFALLATTSGLMLATLAFGFSTNFAWALVCRTLQGSFMGLIVISKAILRDVCDETNIALAMSIMFTGYTTGGMIGPGMAGYVAFPTDLYPNTFPKDGFFFKFAIFLPNFIITGGFLLCIIIAYKYIPSDKKYFKIEDLKPNPDHCTINNNKSNPDDCIINNNESNLDICTINNNKSNPDLCTINNNKSNPDLCTINNNKQSNNTVTYTKTECIEVEHLEKVKHLNYNTTTPWYKVLQNYIKNLSVLKLLRTKDCFYAVILYGTYSIVAIGFIEMFPVYAATSEQYNGLAMLPNDIGTLFLVTSLLTCFPQIFVSPKFLNTFGAKKTFCGCSLLFAVVLSLTPVVGNIKHKTARWLTLLALQVIVGFVNNCCMIAVNMFINNSVLAENVGLANGLGMSSSSIGRTIAPICFGRIYTWSLSNISSPNHNQQKLNFPFNQYFVFFLMSVLSVLNAAFVYFFPDTLNSNKR